MAKRTNGSAAASTSSTKAHTSTAAPPAKRARFAATEKPRQLKKAAPPSAPVRAAKKVKTATTPPTHFIVSSGSYERLLYGLRCHFETSAEPASKKHKVAGRKLVVEPYFAFPAHLSSLKSVAASRLVSPDTGSERKVGGKYLVSGGTDEIIKVWDLKRRREVGTLEGEANGTITCLQFVPHRNMLLAASTDSNITLYRVRDWVLLRALKGHKGRVNSVDAHPAGRVALSVGQDKMLRMWDLVAGKAVSTMKLGAEGDVVRWNTDGTKFATICGNQLTVYGVDMTVLHALSGPSRFHDVHFSYFPLDKQDPAQSEYMFVACEDGKTRIFDVATPSVTDSEVENGASTLLEPVAVLVGHKNRVKMLDLLEVAVPDAETSTVVAVSASSDGLINVYDLAVLPSSAKGEKAALDIEPSGTYDTEASRLTCVCAIGLTDAPTTATEGEDHDDEIDESEEDESDADESDSGSEPLLDEEEYENEELEADEAELESD
ncbi:hypothetical protein ACM66B_001082 [Microbotryomycetes sp. NB124-2]